MIISIFGEQGSGKTLFMTKMAYAEYKSGRTVYSNYPLSFPHKELKFEDMMNCNYQNAFIAIDEAHLWGLDARDSMTKKNKGLVKQFIVQVRKQDVDLFITTQFPRQLDVRVRENSEYFIFVNKWVYDVEDKRSFEAIQSQNYGDRLLVVKCEWVRVGNGDVRIKYFLANKYYGLYDTKKVIEMQ